MSTNHTDAPQDPWAAARAFTDARIALGRTGNGLPTRHLLDFQMAHAQARDSVHTAFEADALAAKLTDLPMLVLSVHSAAADRMVYLQRPDLGRLLAEGEEARLKTAAGAFDLVVVIGDGLSARAVHDHAEPTLRALLAGLDETWNLGPVVLARQARVALGDPIGKALGADITLMLIGERPGLSSADSLGAYITWGPKSGRTNADRNCVSNIRDAGLPPAAAAHKLAYLLRESRHARLSGVALKDDAPSLLGDATPTTLLTDHKTS